MPQEPENGGGGPPPHRYRGNRMSLTMQEKLHRMTPDERDRHRTLVIIGFAANVVFVIGTVCFLYFTILEFNGRDRSMEANAVYVTAFVCFFLNGMIELYIDLFFVRTFRHGRYSHRKPYNLAISSLFVIGTVLDTAAFFMWNKRKFLKEHRIQYGSSHAMLLGMIIVIGVEGLNCGTEESLMENLATVDGLDALGNLIFFAGVICDCFTRYLEDDPSSPRAIAGVMNIEIASASLFVPTALIYLAADVLRYFEHKREDERIRLQQQSRIHRSKKSKPRSGANNV